MIYLTYRISHIQYNLCPNICSIKIKETHCRVIYQLVAAMDDDWRECVDTERHLYVMTIKANISHFCSNIMFSVNTITAVFYLLGDYVIRFVHLSGDYNDTFRQFPIKVQFPFETQQSPVFELLAVILFLHVMLNACTLSIVNALISTLVSLTL